MGCVLFHGLCLEGLVFELRNGECFFLGCFCNDFGGLLGVLIGRLNVMCTSFGLKFEVGFCLMHAGPGFQV